MTVVSDAVAIAAAAPARPPQATTARLGIAGPVTVRDLLPLVDGPGRETGWCSAGSPLLTTLIRELLGRGLALSVFTCDEALEDSDRPWVLLEGARLRLYVVPRRARPFRLRHGRPGRIVDLFRLERKRLCRAIVHDAPVLVHAHWSYEYAAAAQASGRPSLVTCHDSPRAILRSMPDAYRLGRYAMAWWVLRRATQVSVVSPYLVDELEGWTRRRPDIVPNPVPDVALRLGAPRKHWAHHGGPPRIGMVLNGWSPRKNAAAGMQALLQVRRRHPQAEMHLVGPDFGPGGPAWQWAAAHGAEAAFLFHGRLGHDDTMTLMHGMDLLVHPALEESFGLTIAEAMALGVPVVAGESSGAVPWVTGGVSGSLVDVRSATAIAAAVEALLDDGGAYETASARAHARAREHFSAAAVASRYLQLYGALGTLSIASPEAAPA